MLTAESAPITTLARSLFENPLGRRIDFRRQRNLHFNEGPC